ncbi:hypothetical protein [Bacillus pumilus]|uniref:hypothetical protein n=1 Tax=Bacillus pumilus TaxID=1408 RepID=UPI0011AA8A36|nr:hypothetical protein [Bacillus pumilus]
MLLKTLIKKGAIFSVFFLLGAKKLAVSIGVAVAIALNYLDIGTQIAKQLDKRDKRPNNGWVDIY